MTDQPQPATESECLCDHCLTRFVGSGERCPDCAREQIRPVPDQPQPTAAMTDAEVALGRALFRWSISDRKSNNPDDDACEVAAVPHLCQG